MVLLGDMRGGYICTEMSLSKRLKCLKVRWREKLGTNRIVKLISESHFQILFPDCNFPFFLGDSKNMHFYIIDFHIQFYSSLVGGAMIFCSDKVFTTRVTRLSRCTFTFPNWRTVWERVSRKKVAVILDFVQMRGWGRALPKFFVTFS